MSRKIKETPILTGKAAERFDKIIKDNEDKKVPASEYERAMANYKAIIKEA